MTRKFIVLGALASLALSTSSRAEELANPAAPLGSAVLTGKISCNGYLNVPMTADQEQSLPLQVIANLECGQEVAVLSDDEGYTVNIRTADGKNGYIARMYLTRAVRKRADALAPADNATLNNGVARWQSGSKGSYEFTNGDKLVESLTANGITVQVSLQDTGWKMRANVAVVNASQQPIYVLPRVLSLDETAPMAKPLRYQDPAEVAKAANHQILWTSASAGPTGSVRAQRTSSASSADLYTVNYKLPSSDPSPNYLAQHQALEEIAAKNQGALAGMAREINALSLREGNLKPNEKTAGDVWFERDAKSNQFMLRVPVGDVIFEFPLSFNHEK